MGFKATLFLVFLLFCLFVCFLLVSFVAGFQKRRPKPPKNRKRETTKIIFSGFGHLLGRRFQRNKRKNKQNRSPQNLHCCVFFLSFPFFIFLFLLFSFFCLSFFPVSSFFCFKGEETEKMKRKQRQKNMAEDNTRIIRIRQEEQ